MRRWLWLGGMCALLLAGPARAQFANKSLGLQVGFLSLNGATGEELDFGIPVGLTGSIYIENGFDVVAHVGIMVVHDKVLNQNVLALDGPALGIRYLFLEESIRPFAGVDLSFLNIFGSGNNQQNTAFAGLGPNAGVEFFVSDSISIGLVARFNLYVSLNEVWESFGANAQVSAYF
jgi:outer membrane protein